MVVEAEAQNECKQHGKEIVDIQRPFMGKEVSILSPYISYKIKRKRKRKKC